MYIHKIKGGRLTKFKGTVASIAPGLLVAVLSVGSASAGCSPAGPFSNVGEQIDCNNNPGFGSQMLSGTNLSGGDDRVIGTVTGTGSTPVPFMASLGGSNPPALLYLGAGNDTIALDATNGGSIQFFDANPAAINGGDGNDIFDANAQDGLINFGDNTTINGGAGNDEFVLSSGPNGAAKMYKINAGLGNDHVSLQGAGSNVSNNISLGGGNNLLEVFNGSVGGNVSAGGGSDTVDLNGGSISGSIHLGGGDDEISIVGGQVSGAVHAGSGNDEVTFTAASIGGTTYLGAGNDELHLNAGSTTEDVYADAGDDEVTLAGATVNGFLHLGDGEDTLNMTSGFVTGHVYAGAGDDVVNLTGATVDGFVHLGAGNDTATWTSGSLANFYGGDGSDTLTVTGSGYTGSETLNGGDDVSSADGMVDVLTLDGTTITAISADLINWEIITLDGGSVLSITDNALIVGSDSGTGLNLKDASVLNAGDAFTLTGNLNTSSGGTFSAVGTGAGVYSVSGSVSNDGIITMQDGGSGDVMAVSGNYGGSGSGVGPGELLLDTDFAADDSDSLTVAGNISGGTTMITINDVTNGVATGNDLLVVDVAGTTVASDFVLAGGPVISGAYNYNLELQNTQWFLAGDVNSTGAVYEATPSALLTGFTRMSSLEQRVGQRQSLSDNSNTGVWFRLEGDALKTTPSQSTSGSSHDVNTFTGQAGWDFSVPKSAEGQWVIGATAQYGKANIDVTNALGFGVIDATGYGIGATATWYGNTGTYFDAQGQVNWIESDISSSNSGSLIDGNSSTAYALSFEVGHKYQMSATSSLVPQAQISWGGLSNSSFTDTQGNLVSYGNTDQVTARVGLAYEYESLESNLSTGRSQKAYVIGNIINEFSGGTSVNVAGTELSVLNQETWAEVGLGGSVSFNKNASIYGQGTYRTTLGGGQGEGFALGGGLSVQW